MTSATARADGIRSGLGRWRLGWGGLLNVLSVGFAVAAVLAVVEPEIMLDALWITLAIGAFFFSFGVALLRLAIGSAFVIGFMVYESIHIGEPFEVELLDLAEWPLLIVISLIVTLMAHRLATTSRRYGALYRVASDRLVRAHEEERGRLSRDLHDSVGQNLTAVLLSLDTAEARLADPMVDTEGAQTAVRRAHVQAAAALDEARHVAQQLRPPRLSEIGLGAAIKELVETSGLPIELRFDPAILAPGVVEPNQEIGAYRIVQEAIGNVSRHARAERVWIDATVRPASVQVTVVDDGVGFEPSATAMRGIGMDSMQERAEIIGASLAVKSAPGRGTRVSLTMARSAPNVQAPTRAIAGQPVR